MFGFVPRLAPSNVHAAFDKAAHYFCMRLVHIPLDKKTYRVNVKVGLGTTHAETQFLVSRVKEAQPGFLVM